MTSQWVSDAERISQEAAAKAWNHALDCAMAICRNVYKEHKASGNYPLDMGGLAQECEERIRGLKERASKERP